jgi:hypothetical protein
MFNFDRLIHHKPEAPEPKPWRPRWLEERLSQPQYRDRNGKLLKREKPRANPEFSNHDKHVMRRLRRAQAAQDERQEGRHDATRL